MAGEILNRDQNHVTVLAGVTNDADLDVTMLRVDPITKRLLVAASGGGSSGLVVGTTTITGGVNGQLLYNNNGVLGTIAASGTGTVTSVSVVSANGFAGSVANATTTPAITISTSISGILQGDGTAISPIVVGSGLSFVGGTLSATGGGTGTVTIVTSVDTSVTITNPTTTPDLSVVAITVADTTDSSSFVALFESATGVLAPKTDAGITYNATTGVLTSTFVGNLTGNVTGNSDTITVANEATDTSCFIGFYTAASGSLGGKTNANLTFNSNTGVLTSASSILTTTDINGGTVDGTIIGGSSAAAITGTTITVNTNLVPDANNGAGLGISGTAFSDLFLASGAVIDFAAGNSVITHSSAVLTVSTGDLRVTTAGTNSASVVTVGGTQTLTAKTLTTPTIGDFSNATHNHSNNAGGGLIAVNFRINGPGFTVFTTDASTVPTGKIKGYWTCPYNATITGWNIMVDTGTVTIKVWKVATGTAVPTSGNSINTAGVALSTGTAIHSTTTSDFTTTTVTANDIFAYNIETVSGVTQMTFQLELTRI